MTNIECFLETEIVPSVKDCTDEGPTLADLFAQAVKSDAPAEAMRNELTGLCSNVRKFLISLPYTYNNAENENRRALKRMVEQAENKASEV